ncbi:MAG: mobile mystery protein A [Motiliproteus sp.]
MKNTFKLIEREQCREVVDQTSEKIKAVPSRKDWISLVRKALGMSSSQLANRLKVSRNQAAKLERAEKEGGITIRRLNEVAQAMGCRLVYSFVPETSVSSMIEEQARKKAVNLLASTSVHMMLEDQELTNKQKLAEIRRLQAEIVDEIKGLWDKDVLNPSTH